MGNSTRTLQQVVDSVRSIGDLTPIFPMVSGYAAEPALTIGTNVMAQMLSQNYNFKFNRAKVPAFPLTSNQQDYPSVSLRTLGWLESAAVVDVNSTAFPKPVRPIAVTGDLPMMSWQGMPSKISTLPNEDLEYSLWPGPGVVYVNPIGVLTSPVNPPTAITDPNGVILTLKVYGTTGNTSPTAPVDAKVGDPITDGTCLWTICDAGATGFRVSPRPPQAGNVWLMRVFAQAKPLRFTSLKQTLDPIPDDFSVWFDKGFIAEAHLYSANPAVKARHTEAVREWMAALAQTKQQAAREPESYGFYPDRTVVDQTYSGWDNPLPGRRWS